MVRRKKNLIQGHEVPMLSVKQISEKHGFHPNTIRAWIKHNDLRSIKHGAGGKLFVRQDDVQEFIEKWYDLDNEED